MNALIKLGVPVLVVGLLVFGTALAVVQQWLPDGPGPEFSEHPLMLAAMYAGLLMAATGILMIVVGEMKRHDETSSIRKQPQRGRPLKRGTGAAPSDPPVIIDDSEREPDTTPPPRPKKTLTRDAQVSPPSSGAPGDVHRKHAGDRRKSGDSGNR